MEEKKSLMERLDVALGKVKTFLSDDKESSVKLAAEVVKEDGTVVYTEADEFAVGATAWVKDGEQTIPAPDGEHKLEDGRVLVVKEGVVESIMEAEVEEEMSNEPEYVTRGEFNELASIIKDAINLSKEIASESDLAKEKAAELEAKLSQVEEEKKEVEAKLNEVPAAPSVKTENNSDKPTPQLTKAQLSAMPYKERIKLYREFPELQPNKAK